MNQANQTRTQDLAGAFDIFNSLSEKLISAYGDLEQRVGQLQQELQTARDERIEQLAEKEKLANRLQHLLAALPGGVVVRDGNGVITDCNRVAEDMLGEPLLGARWEDITTRAFHVCSTDGLRITLRDGRQVSLSINPLGSEPGAILLLQDITELVSLQRVVDRQRRLSSMGEMVASLAHQLRTPLAAALLYATNLTNHTLDAEGKARSAAKLIDRLRHLDNLVNDMLVFARGGSLATDPMTTDELLDRLRQYAEPLLASKQLELRIQPLVPALYFQASKDALVSALMNLVNNAVDAKHPDPVCVRVTVTALERGVQLDIADDGPGVAESIQERIFEPFFTTRSSGTGLGLAVTRAVVLAHNGNISVDSSPGKGTRFSIRLPLAINDALLASGHQTATSNESMRRGSKR